MSIQGALAASLRRFDPYPAFDLVFDPKGLIVPGRPIYKLAGRYFDRPEDMPGWSYVRSGADLIVPAPGGWRRFAANAVPIVRGYGLECADDTTNKCTDWNARPAAFPMSDAATFSAGANAAASGDPETLFGFVDMTAEIAADPDLAPLLEDGTLNGIALVIDNTLGATNAWVRARGQLGNVNTHAASGCCKVLVAGPVGLPNIGLGTLTTATHPGGSGFVWFGGAGVPTDGGARVQMSVRPGGKAAWLLWQGEEKVYFTPPVVVAGAQASRGSPQAQLGNLSPLFSRPFTLVAKGKGRAADNVNRTLVQVDNGSNASTERIQLARTPANGLSIQNGGGGNEGLGAGSALGVLDVRMAAQIRADGVDRSVAGNLNGSTSTETSTLADRHRLFVGTSGAGTTTWSGGVEFIGCISRATTQQEREVLTA